MMSTTPAPRALNVDNINPNIRAAQYAVRGEIAVRSEKYRAQLKEKAQQPPTPPSATQENAQLPFDTVISANIGNPQQLDQKPITFFRQVLSLLENPDLLRNEDALTSTFNYPSDVIDRAKWLLSEVKSVGAYSASQGVPAIRQSVADFIARRDGYPANKDDIFLSAGASAGVNIILSTICNSPKTGILVPIPQYPLYTATLAVLGATCVPYYLDEANAWGTNVADIRSAYEKARKEGVDVRAIAVINPGNPTGASLSRGDIENVLGFAAEAGVVVLADEVYQTNIFQGSFHSFKSVLRSLQSGSSSTGDNKNDGGEKYQNLELASLNSISKGMVGECGHRGGYFELTNFDPDVKAQIYKFVSINLCAPVVGQCLVEMQCHPPTPGSPSYPLYHKEYEGIKDGLKERAYALWKAFQDMEGVECQEPQGSMYLFPTIHVPEKAVRKAEEEGRAADEFYCSRLLDSTGICMVGGTGFGQKEGTLHLRTTFLAPGTEWVGRIGRFHEGFMEEFR